MRTLPPLETDARSLAFHPDGRLATVSWNAMYFWDPVTGEQSLHAWLSCDRTDTTPLSFSPDGRWALLDYHLIEVSRLVAPDSGPPPPYWGDSAAWARRHLPRPEAGKIFLKRHPLNVWSRDAHLALAGDGLRLVAVGAERMWIWEYEDTREVGWAGRPTQARVRQPFGSSDDKLSVALSPDGCFCGIARCPRGGVRVCRLDTGEEGGLTFAAARRVLFSPDGRYLALGEDAGDVGIWDARHLDSLISTSEVTRLHTQHPRGRCNVPALAFSPDGRFLAAGNAEGIVHVWETGTWAEVEALDWQIGGVRAVAFAPDGMTAAAAGSDDKVIVWDVDA